jgi:photosystem II stability/assembly factor-like uncharacterized protein
MYACLARFHAVWFALAFAIGADACAADEPVWQGMIGNLPKSEQAGFGGLCGVCIDHETGAILINISDRGFYRSTDDGKTFQRLSSEQPKGRTETPGCLLLDPTGAGKRLLTALVYGSPPSLSTDGGIRWKMMDGKAAHVDWCAIDWTAPDPKFVLALKHEAGGLLLASHDGGKSFAEIGKGFGPGWVFDNQTAVAAQVKTRDRPHANLARTDDGGSTWKPCGAFSPVGSGSVQALPKWRDGVLYWLVEGALIATRDKGQTWTKISSLPNGRYGPVFGKTTQQLFVLTNAGIVESTDGGTTWSKPTLLPKELKGSGGLTWLEYDPRSNALYIMKMGSDLFKMSR